jgi:hypothetical protein
MYVLISYRLQWPIIAQRPTDAKSTPGHFRCTPIRHRRRTLHRHALWQRTHQRHLLRRLPAGRRSDSLHPAAHQHRDLPQSHHPDGEYPAGYLAPVESAQQAYQAARAFGHFQKLLVDLPAPHLHATIPDFHNTPKRFAAFEQAVVADSVGRAIHVRAEIDFAFAHQSIAAVLLDANLPQRVTHNDTKFNNVLLDDATGEGICVIDLDTVMPGLSLYDFGDMVRTTTSPAMEDEQDLSKVALQFPMFEALARGYLSSAGSFLTRSEKQHLAVAGKVIAFEQGIRFLADHLTGDTYYKIHRLNHNLDRCRTQFKLVESIEQQEDKMNVLISELLDWQRE